VRAADGFAVWGNDTAGTRLLHRALEAGRPRAPFVTSYIQGLQYTIQERVAMDDHSAVANYCSFARHMLTDAQLADFATPELKQGLAGAANLPSRATISGRGR
jgi:hypothetical protein